MFELVSCFSLVRVCCRIAQSSQDTGLLFRTSFLRLVSFAVKTLCGKCTVMFKWCSPDLCLRLCCSLIYFYTLQYSSVLKKLGGVREGVGDGWGDSIQDLCVVGRAGAPP